MRSLLRYAQALVQPRPPRAALLYGTRQFPRSIQLDDYSCGARAAYMIAVYYGRRVSYGTVKKAVDTNEKGTRVKPLLSFFRRHALRTSYRPTLSFRELLDVLAQGGVVIAHLDGDHLGVVHGVWGDYVYLADPSIVRQRGRRITRKQFWRRWAHWGITVRER